MKISAIVLTKDNEKTIKRSLKSVQWCYEILVIDDFSTDKTPQIAQKLGAKVYKRDLKNNFSKQRNFGLKKAKGDWILFVDSDEVVTTDLKKEITNYPLDDSNYNGFYITRQDVLWEKKLRYGESGNIKLIRLGKRGFGVWRRSVHEQWTINGEVGYLKSTLLHFSHSTIRKFVAQINFHSSLHTNALIKEKKRASVTKIFLYPTLKFINNFIIRRGFLDGVHGFVAAMLMSFHSFLAWSKLWLVKRT